jgi:hypothetical protein
MGIRLARGDEIATWRDDGWVLVDGLVGTEEIDAAAAELHHMFPTPERYHADPRVQTQAWLGRPPVPGDAFIWPKDGPGFRPEQHRWRSEFPFPEASALNRLCVHPAVVDFAQRALESSDLRIYQAQALAKYTGDANYEQPMHTDRNHSWLPASREPSWWHVEGFLYLSDVHDANAPTHLVSVNDSVGRATTDPLIMPNTDPGLYGAERPARGRRGSLLAYRPDVFHRAVDLVEPGGARFLLNVSFKIAGQDWIGFHAGQSAANSPDWTAFVEGSTPEELALFGFPRPGHPIWDEAFIASTGDRYPALDLMPWLAALGDRANGRS